MPRKGSEYERTKRRRAEWIAENGPCQRCGSSEKLEVDHIDRSLKTMEPQDIWQRRQEVRDTELANCQVLCNACHLLKSAEEHRRTHCGPCGAELSRYASGRSYCAPCDRSRDRALKAKKGYITGPRGPYKRKDET